mmetsp:Transcript_34596/g.86937  ORF Transcript_34596/g.86937 Transcript_34596/m.86937 type:complete len:304 (+) Transcript_34596:3445-4356(+)|eukprot:CAMPEP_0177641236 /NCGR_PEP_ID=MMETSP0447-20121125/6960_1 /TAXON_ID=0 /ORGANISM="Stygamoeba regulata, Strain BSH-02190019" /LENGTH=303 /DNA_ID=CAMNT_0019143343 /DNA_START=55 /DNA_END=966 /DNA_ORIENTATION=+
MADRTSNISVPKKRKKRGASRGAEKDGRGKIDLTFMMKEENPFSDLKFSDELLEEMANRPGRVKCPKCQKMYKFYCYNCMIGLVDGAPTGLKLPLDVEVVHYPTEKMSKTTAVHSAVVAPGYVHFHQYPDVPQFEEGTVVLYPSKDAVGLEEMSTEELSSIKKVVFIESQWQKGNRVASHENLASLKRVKIKQRQTRFWRYQSVGEECLATIEAIYYFFREYAERLSDDGRYNGEYDDLMFYFALFHRQIFSRYNSEKKSSSSTDIDAATATSRADDSEDGDTDKTAAEEEDPGEGSNKRPRA